MKEYRTCSECGKQMSAGYVIDGGMEYFCSDECLHKHYTDEEYLEMYDEGNGDSYWTEWDDEDGTTNSDVFEPHEKQNPEPLYNVIENGKEQKWFSVKDAMPANDDDVLVWNGVYCEIANAYDGEDGREFFVDSPSSRPVTHWMPLPKPPKEG